MNNTHSNSNKVISRKTKPRSSFKQKGGDFSDDFAGLNIEGSQYCWLAASIQLLWSIKPFRDFLLQHNLYDIIAAKVVNTSDDDERIFYEALDFYEANMNKSEPDIFHNINEITLSFKEEQSKNFKNIILALSKVFQLYKENITNKTEKATQVTKDVVFNSHDGTTTNTVMEILEKAGQQAEKSDKSEIQQAEKSDKSEIQRDSNEFLMYIFGLFEMSNNNELMKTISHYSKTYSTVIVTKEDRINTFNEYLDHVNSYKYKIIEYDAKISPDKIKKSYEKDITNMISEGKKLINEQEIDNIVKLVKLVKALTKEDTSDTENKKIIQKIQKKIFTSYTETIAPNILEQLIVDKKVKPNAMEVDIKLLLTQDKTIATDKRDQLNTLLEFIIKKMKILTLLEKYNNISLFTEISNFATDIFMIIKAAPSSDDQTKTYTMQELVDIYKTTSHIIVPIESKYILIKREPTTTPMNKTIANHKKIKIGNISYKLYGCISYSGIISSGHYYYIAFLDDDSLLELNDSGKTLYTNAKDKTKYDSKLEEIQTRASIYLYEKEEVLVNATEEYLAASTLALVATAILAQPQVTANAEAKKKAREAAKINKEALDTAKKAAIDAENRAQEAQPTQQEQDAAAERARLQQEQKAAEERARSERQEAVARERQGKGLFKRQQVPSEAEDNNEDEPTDPYRYAESPDYGSSAENIVLGTLLCITIIISTVMLSK